MIERCPVSPSQTIVDRLHCDLIEVVEPWAELHSTTQQQDTAMAQAPNPLSFAHLWQQEELSDISIVLKQEPEAVQGQQAGKKRKTCAAPDNSHSHPARAPCHSFSFRLLPSAGRLLGHVCLVSGATCCMLTAPSCWMCRCSAGSRSSRVAAKPAAKPEASLTLRSVKEEPAAMAVLAALYGVSTPAGQLSDLQQLHVVLLADMLQVPAVAAQPGQQSTTWPPSLRFSRACQMQRCSTCADCGHGRAACWMRFQS